MPNGNRGPVDFGTMLQMQGALQAERGFARAWSAGSTEAVKAAYMRSAAEKGALAAENIRQRYYKKEFEQVLETRVKPLQDRLATAKEIRNQTIATTVMPVSRTVSPEEYQQRAEALGQGGPVQFQAIPGAAGKEGGGVKEVIPQQPPAPNAALDKQIGAIESEDVLAVIDPVSGGPVPLASPRGISVMQKADSDFWGEYSAVNQELMQVMSEYPGNPYADRYAENLIDSVIKQSNIATTGKTDPRAAQEWMEGRQQFEAEQEVRQQAIGEGRFGIETREAGLDVITREAEQLAKTDSSFIGLLGKTIKNKFNIGQSLTRREKFEAANAVRTYRDLQEKELAKKQRRLVREKIFTISDTNLPNPENWQSEMRTRDPVHQQYFGEEYANFVNNQVIEVMRMPEEERTNLLTSFGASPEDIALFDNGLGSISPGMRTAFERMANSKNANVISNDMAMIRRLPELERQQPELVMVIDQTIDAAINQMRAEGRTPDETLLRADRYRTFFEIAYGREAPKIYDPRTLRQVGGILGRRELERLSQLPEEVIEPVPEEEVSIPETQPTIGSILPEKKPRSLLLRKRAKEAIMGISPEEETPKSPYKPFSWVSKPVL